jgi:hypothetical protein
MVEIGSRSLGRQFHHRLSRAALLPALALILVWQVWIGGGRPHSLSAPAGEVGLCLALMVWRLGGGAELALALWGFTLLSFSAVGGVAPIWLFLVGWPAWVMVRALAPGVRDNPLTFVLLAAGLLSVVRCGGKLLLLAWPELGSPLTLSGPGLLASLLSEAVPNIAWLWAFWLLLKTPERASR